MTRRIAFLKNLDKVVGGIASFLPPPKCGSGVTPRRILVIRPGGIGDAVLLMPALITLKTAYPAAQLTVLAERRNGSAFALCPAVDRLLLYDAPAQLLRATFSCYDLAIDSEQWHRLSAVVARLVNAPVSIGFATNERSRLFCHQVPYSHQEYEVDSFLKLLEPLGIPRPQPVPVPFVALPAPARARARELLGELASARFVTVFPGASIPERRWGGDRFHVLAERLAKKGLPVVVVGGKADCADGEQIVQGVGGLNLAGRSSLAETAALIEASALLVSGDSGVLHLAVGLGARSVSLFGPGIQAKWGPRGEGHIVLNNRLPCSPCTLFGTTPHCPSKARCLSGTSVDEVVDAVQKLVS